MDRGNAVRRTALFLQIFLSCGPPSPRLFHDLVASRSLPFAVVSISNVNKSSRAMTRRKRSRRMDGRFVQPLRVAVKKCLIRRGPWEVASVSMLYMILGTVESALSTGKALDKLSWWFENCSGGGKKNFSSSRRVSWVEPPTPPQRCTTRRHPVKRIEE